MPRLTPQNLIPSTDGATWTIAAISNPRIFANRYPMFASVARKFILVHPEWRGMRLYCAWVFATRERRFGSACAVQIESRERKVQFQLEMTVSEIVKSVVFDRAKEAWER
jgi:hypothetical protein